MAVGARGRRVGGTDERRADVEIAAADIQRIAVPAATAEAIMMIASQPDRHHFGAALADRRERIDIVAQHAVIELAAQLQIVVVTADQRIGGIEAADMLAAVRVEHVELLAEPVVEIGVSRAKRQIARLRLVGHTPILQPAARGQHAQAHHIANSKRLVEIDRAAALIQAGIGVARVACLHVAGDPVPWRDIDQQIGRADVRTRTERRTHAHARQIGQQQQPALERRGGDQIATLQPADRVRRGAIAQ
ncbi:hypothetical protein BHE90_017701, partial [Fusarium euwallaceae]